MFVPDPKVYEAAREFAMQKSIETVRNTLLNSIDFDEDNINEVMSIAEPHRLDIDGGYSVFIEAVNQVFGEEVYCVECDYKKYKKGEACSL